MPEPIRLVDLGELVGRAEIAERAGIAPKTIDSWRRRYADSETPFPEPVGVISSTPLWEWPLVERWIRDTPREVGRPPIEVRNSSTAPLPVRLSHAGRIAGVGSRSEETA